MEKLKKYSIKYFILFAFALSVTESILDSCFDEIFKTIRDYTISSILMAIYIALCIGVFLLFSRWFAVIMNQKIEEETKRQNNERNMLYANLAHDLKTPITVILGFSQALQEKRVKEEEKEEFIASIYEKAKKSDELLNILFQYAKMDTSNYQMNLQQHDICRLIREEIALLYESFEDKQMEVIIEVPERSIMREVDKVEFQRAISNLLTNAFRHNVEKAKVLIRLLEENNKVKIMVADNGDSIPKEIENSLFDPFICADESRNSKGGNGLGLAISKKIVEKHGGCIYFDTNVKGYTKGFVIMI